MVYVLFSVGNAAAVGVPNVHVLQPTQVVAMVTAQVDVLLPLIVVTVITADPAVIPVTRPVELTVATAVLFEAQLTVLIVAFAGDMVAVNCAVAPVPIVAVDGLTTTPVTGTIEQLVIVITTEAVFAPSVVVTVIVAEPNAIALSIPVELIKAMEGLLEVHFTVLIVAFDGVIIGDNCTESPTQRDEGSVKETPVTAILATETLHVALKPPSAVVTVIIAVPDATTVTKPCELTLATAELLVDQVTALFVALDGNTVAVN